MPTGGIDFVMKPLGRFFQVTETVDAGKYFLDIDKVQRYPITFIVKSKESSQDLLEIIRQQANQKYGVEKIVNLYLDCVEEIINVPMLIGFFEKIVSESKITPVIEEIILQSRVEFNVEAEDTSSVLFDKTAKDNEEWQSHK